MSVCAIPRRGVPAAIAWAAALVATACGGQAAGPAGAGAGQPAGAAPQALVTISPSVELMGLADDGELGVVYVDDLLLHLGEIRLTRTDGTAGPDAVTAPIWVEFHHSTGAAVRGAEDVEVPPGEYNVALTLSPSRFQRRQAGELNQASVVVRGTCIVVEDDGAAQGPNAPMGARNPGFQSNNPVPMPARPGEGGERLPAPSRADRRMSRLIQVPFSARSAAVLSIELPAPIRLDADGDLTVRIDVPRWIESAIHPVITSLVADRRAAAERLVDLDFSADQDGVDPMAEMFAAILGESIAGAVSAGLTPP